jgi:DNA-binding NarL/FixJ family response regulator
MVVDDHPIWRDAVARDLTEAGYAVVATAADGAQALRVAGAARPDVVVLDLRLPDMSGVELTRGLQAANPAFRVLVLSASGEQQDVLDAVKARAVGYLLKSATGPELLDAVRRTADGEAVFTPGLAALVLGEFRRLSAAPAGAGRGVPRLSERETEILRMVATDGLDELDAEGPEKPERGLEAIRRLNAAAPEEYPINAPIILTCRTSYFQRLEQFQLRDKDLVIGLAGAGLLQLEPLNADQIAKFLDRNLRAEAKARWGKVLRALNTLQQPPVVNVLGLPWRLILAFSAYQNGGFPDRLLAGDGKVAEAELLPQFLRMALQKRSTDAPGGNPTPRLKRQWLEAVEGDPVRVARWLKAIAQYLEKDRAAGGGAGVLLMYEIYKMVNPRRLRLVYGICALIVIAIAGLATFVTALSGPHPFPRIVAIAVAAVFLAAAAYVVALRPPSTPAGFTLRQAVQTPQGVLDLLISLLCALAASAFALGTQNTLLYRVVGGLCCGFMAGLFFGFVHSKRLRARGVGLQYSETPTDPLRGGLVNSSIIGAVVGSIYAIVLLANGAGLVKSILFGMLAFLAFAPILGLPMFSVAWTRYKLGLLILFFERRLPWRINAFMAWSYNTGLMRTAGLTYQFRHLRMQAWFAETDEADLFTPLPVAEEGPENAGRPIGNAPV